MSGVTGDSPFPHKKRCCSVYIINATDAISSAPVKDTNGSNVSASPSNAPISSDIKAYKVYKTVFDSRVQTLGIWKDASIIVPTAHLRFLCRVHLKLVAGYWTLVRVKKKGRWSGSSGCLSLGESNNTVLTLKHPQDCHQSFSCCYSVHVFVATHFWMPFVSGFILFI